LRISPPQYLYGDQTPRRLATPPWTAYLKIAEGCDHRCAFCVIPRLRGRFRSRTIESSVAEAQALARRGVRELNLVAQDTTCYGRDLYGRPRIADLLRALAPIADVRWLRLMYCHPGGVTDELMSLMRDEPKLCRYIDLPLQHSERELLRAMRRPGSAQSYLALIERLRERVPGIAVRTSIVVGFPGETEAQFEALLAFMAQARFDRAGAFVYSREEGTPAAALPNQVARELARERYQRVMELQQQISLERNREWVGRALEVLVEARGDGELGWVGRSYRDAPEIDGLVYLCGGPRVKPGDFVRARITAAREYDLEGAIES
jgi:ribosomal protein S12 methylthiotransferase